MSDDNSSFHIKGYIYEVDLPFSVRLISSDAPKLCELDIRIGDSFAS